MGQDYVQSLVGGQVKNLLISDNIEEFRYIPRSLKVLDAVFARPDGKVAKASAMLSDQTCIGVVLKLVDQKAGICSVITQGLIKGFATDLKPGASYFLSSDAGKLTLEPPTEEGRRVQFVGIAGSRTDMILMPDLRMFVNLTGGTHRRQVFWNPQIGRFELE